MKTLSQNFKFPLEPPVVISNFDISKACRICLSTKNLVSIFDDTYVINNISLAQLIQECSNYEVTKHDNYPQRICKQCIENARLTFMFRRQCEISHKLINTINKNNNKQKDLEDNSTQTPKISNSCGDYDRRIKKPVKEKNADSYKLGRRKGHTSFSEKLKKPVNFVRNAKHYIKKPKVIKHVDTSSTCTTEDTNLKTSSSISNEEFYQMKKSDIEENASKIQKMLMKTCHDMIKTNKLHKKEKSTEDSIKPLKKSFYTYNNKDKEKPVRNPSVTYECNDCKTKFPTITEYQKHNKICKKDILLKLSKMKSDKLSTIATMKTNSTVGKKKYKKMHQYCKICNKVFTNVNTYRNHIKMHENLLVYACLYCNKKYVKAQNLSVHIERCHPEKSTLVKQYKTCHTCKKLYPTKDLFDKQKNINNTSNNSNNNKINIDKNKCPKCKLIDMKISSLNNSNTINNGNNSSGNNNNSCSNAHNTSNTNSRQKLSKFETNTVTGKLRKKIYICNLCNQQFHDIIILKTHQKSHFSKAYQCPTCNIKFNTRHELAKHSKVHSTTDKPNLYTKFSNKLSNNQSMKNNIFDQPKVTNNLPYKCRYCGKCFSRGSEYIAHEACHAAEKKPYLCTTCGKGFQLNSNLILHMRAHRGEKTYKCPLCHKIFALSTELRSHLRSHTENIYGCEHCDDIFLEKLSLIQHQRNIHGINNKISRNSRV